MEKPLLRCIWPRIEVNYLYCICHLSANIGHGLMSILPPDSQNAHNHSDNYFMVIWHNRLYLYSAAALLFGIWFSLKMALKKVNCPLFISLISHCHLWVIVDVLSCWSLQRCCVVSSCWFLVGQALLVSPDIYPSTLPIQPSQNTILAVTQKCICWSPKCLTG